jgi:hypothetical protein
VLNVVVFGAGPACTVNVVAADVGSAVNVPVTLAPVPFVERFVTTPPLVTLIVVFVCGDAENVPVS